MKNAPEKQVAASLFDAQGAVTDAEPALAALRGADKPLARLIEQVGPFRLRVEQKQSLFAALAESIVYQQLNGKAAATIFGRVKALYPDAPFPDPRDVLATDDEKLRGAGLSRGKLLAFKDLAEKTIDGTVPAFAALHALDDDAIVERLTRVRGIGRWTVEMLLIFRMGRANVLPVADYGIRKGFARTFRLKEMPAPSEVARRGERWRPYRTVASWYLWRSLELDAAGTAAGTGKKAGRA